MPLIHLGPAGDTFAGALGVVAGFLLIGGPLILRFQRNRQQFILMQSALTHGVTNFPKGPPFWLLSLRHGLMTLTLGVSLLIVGGIGFGLTHKLTDPTTDTPEISASTQPVTDVPLVPGTLAATPGPLFHPAPPPPNPALEEWHRLKSINTLGIATAAMGFVLTSLGVARIIFSRTEKRHFSDELPS